MSHRAVGVITKMTYNLTCKLHWLRPCLYKIFFMNHYGR